MAHFRMSKLIGECEIQALYHLDPTLTEDEIQDYYVTFRNLDNEIPGYATPKHLERVICAQGIPAKKSFVRDLLREQSAMYDVVKFFDFVYMMVRVKKKAVEDRKRLAAMARRPIMSPLFSSKFTSDEEGFKYGAEGGLPCSTFPSETSYNIELYFQPKNIAEVSTDEGEASSKREELLPDLSESDMSSLQSQLKELNLPEYQKRDLQKCLYAFATFDPDCRGTLPTTRLIHAMMALGERPSKHQLKKLIRRLDKKEVDFSDFVSIMAAFKKERLKDEAKLLSSTVLVLTQPPDGAPMSEEEKQLRYGAKREDEFMLFRPILQTKVKKEEEEEPELLRPTLEFHAESAQVQPESNDDFVNLIPLSLKLPLRKKRVPVYQRLL